jgi:hypothetical protein
MFMLNQPPIVADIIYTKASAFIWAQKENPYTIKLFLNAGLGKNED